MKNMMDSRYTVICTRTHVEDNKFFSTLLTKQWSYTVDTPVQFEKEYIQGGVAMIKTHEGT